MIHGIVTLVFCVAVLFLKLPIVSVLIPVGFYIGREHAQAEHRYIEAHGRKREKYPWWCGFMPEAWNAKACLDCILPVLTAGLTACFAYALGWL